MPTLIHLPKPYEHHNLYKPGSPQTVNGGDSRDSDGHRDAVCLTLVDKHFICNAHNPELWAEMLAEAGLDA